MSSWDESDVEPMSTEMLEDILYSSQSYPRVNRREAHNKKCDCIKKSQA